MEEAAVVVVVLVVAAAGLSAFAGVIGVPYPILLVVGGLVLGLIPGAPRLELQPDIVFLLFLPPLLHYAAYQASLRDLRADKRAVREVLDAQRRALLDLRARRAIGNDVLDLVYRDLDLEDSRLEI